MREAPSLVIIKHLLEAGAKIVAYDPVAIEESKRRIGDTIDYSEDQYEALIDVDALLILTDWPEFKFPKFKIIKKLIKGNVIFDGRNLYDVQEMKKFDFDYYCIGIKSI